MFCFTFLTLGDAKHAKNQTWGKTLVVFKAIKVIPVRKVKSDFLEACVRARPKDSVLTLSGYYNLANKRKISPFSSLKISTNPFLFFFFFLLSSFIYCFNWYFCILLWWHQEAGDHVSGKSWGCVLRPCAAQARYTKLTLAGFNTLQSIRGEFLSSNTWKLFQVLFWGAWWTWEYVSWNMLESYFQLLVLMCSLVCFLNWTDFWLQRETSGSSLKAWSLIIELEILNSRWVLICS